MSPRRPRLLAAASAGLALIDVLPQRLFPLLWVSPLLGYAGYLPFGALCFALGDAIDAAARPRPLTFGWAMPGP